ncbi:unnamed protein product, partial [Prorocentrum cordatum]
AGQMLSRDFCTGHDSFYSMYLYGGVKLGLKNIRIWKALGEDIQRHKFPSMVGGDFNMNPALLSEHVPLHDLDLVIRAPEAHTYRSKDTRTKIDFFLVSALLDRVAPTISVDLNAASHPHSAVNLTLQRAISGASNTVPAPYQ